MLHAEDGRAYRAHVKDRPLSEDMALADYEGKDVTLYGIVDDLRGHWRITLDPSDQNMIFLAPAEPEAEQNLDLDMAASGSRTETKPDVDNEVTREDDASDGHDIPPVERPEEGRGNLLRDADE